MKSIIQIVLLTTLTSACVTYVPLTKVTTQQYSGKSEKRIVEESKILYLGCCGCVGKVFTREVNREKELEFFGDCSCFGQRASAELNARKVLKDGTIKRYTFVFRDTTVYSKSKYRIGDYFKQKELDQIRTDTTEKVCYLLKELELDKFLIQRIRTIKRVDRRYSDVVDSTFQYSVFQVTNSYRKKTKLVDKWAWTD